ncbi:MAG TPA: hypothetical protein PLJ78_13275 [Anaerolineae bacterium]|nr:hypothetical protein [Anaerolineae bacterium]HQK14901.1 hypothetical protein [Anaerolineae bacterium]
MTENEYDFHPPTSDPYRRAVIAPLWLTILAFLCMLVALGAAALRITNYAFFAIVTVFFVLFGGVTLGVEVWGRVQMRRADEFLASDRPVVRWKYALPEWERLKEAVWQEEGGDWKIQLGCLTVLFAITGLLTGLLIGFEESLGKALLGGAIGLVGGGVIGGVIGAVVAGSQHLMVRKAYAQDEPGEVALGHDEVYALGNYFRGNGKTSHVRRVTLQHNEDKSVWLRIEIQLPPRPRGSSEEVWMLPVPSQMVEAVEKALPLIAH